jgi:hypothetical protein
MRARWRKAAGRLVRHGFTIGEIRSAGYEAPTRCREMVEIQIVRQQNQLPSGITKIRTRLPCLPSNDGRVYLSSITAGLGTKLIVATLLVFLHQQRREHHSEPAGNVTWNSRRRAGMLSSCLRRWTRGFGFAMWRQ